MSSIDSEGTDEEISSEFVQDLENNNNEGRDHPREKSKKIDQQANAFDYQSMGEENHPVARV